MSENLTKDFFAGNINTKFRLPLDASNYLELELIEVNANERLREEGIDNFSIIFRGPRVQYLPQGTYRMEHERAGQFEIFIVPIRGDDAGYYYEAVFNRLLE